MIEQISQALNGNDTALSENVLNWNNMSKHEMVPVTYSKRDFSRSWGRAFRFGVKVAKGKRALHKSNIQRLFLSRGAINKRKSIELNASRHEYLSTNDIVTSVLCKLSKSRLMMMNISIREREGYTSNSNDAGNLFCAPHFSTKAGQDPNTIRSVTKAVGGYFKPNHLPVMPFLQGSVGTISSWDRPKLILGEKITNISHFPGEFWFESFLLDFAIIFAVDDDHVGVIHNFLNPRDLQSIDLSDILQS